MIQYSDSVDHISPDNLKGFFQGWPNPPSPDTHLKILEQSAYRWLAIDQGQVVGFVTAISDHVLSAYIPLLEVLPAYQNQGIGKALMQGMLETLSHLYMVDLLCDEPLQAYYEQLDMYRAKGMIIRNYDRQNGQ